MKSIRLPLFLIKILNYEYWTWWFFYLPLLPYWLYQAFRTRSLTFFTNADPCIDYGGFFGESKIDILDKIPKEFLPVTIFIRQGTEPEKILSGIKEAGLDFPVICKPNIGERGFQVEKIMTREALENYVRALNADLIIQEFIDFDIELGVLYYRFPEESKGKVSSVTRKKFLSVKGDGNSTIEELMERSTRARFQLDSMRTRMREHIKSVIPVNQEVLLEPIGNHCRGTMFLDNNFLINERLHEVFNKVSNPIEGFHYGRFDMKVKSVEDLYQGKNIRIMELNGVSSEPGHIYDPGYSLLKAYRDLAYHWKVIANISIQQKRRGINPIPAKEIWEVLKDHFFRK